MYSGYPLRAQRVLGGRRAPRSTVFPLELFHEIAQSLNPRFGERVVDRGAHAADRPVSLQPVQTRRRGVLGELLLELFAGQPERDVYPGPRVLVRVAAVIAGTIDLCVQLVRFALVALPHRLETAVPQQPAHHEPRHADREYGR